MEQRTSSEMGTRASSRAMSRQTAVFGSQKPNGVEVRNQSDAPEILIYDVIGEDPFFGGVSSMAVIDALSSVGSADTVRVRINSPGGDAFEGHAIYNALRRSPASIETHIDALAASAAATIAMAGDRIVMAENAFLMIHRAWGIEIGDAEEMQRVADMLNKLDRSIAGIYSGRSGKTVTRALRMMSDETWMSASDAKAEGFADAIEGRSGARNRFDLSVYDRVPEEIESLEDEPTREAGPPTRRQLERAMQDAGLTRKQARELSAYYTDDSVTRDAGGGAELDDLVERCLSN